jgi:phosphate transport system permease protein
VTATNGGLITIQDLAGDPRRVRKERRVQATLRGAALLSVVISALILFVLLRGTFDFLRELDSFSSLKDTGWFPRRQRFDISTIVVGSIVMGLIAMVVAVPFGLGAAIYLSEYATPRVRKIFKPVIEVLAGIPSVVIGFFVLKFVAPDILEPLLHPDKPRNMLAAGIGIGVLVIPIMAAVSEDALRAVPGSLREASFGVGARKSSTVVKVVLPAAVSGIVAAFIIAVSRTIGETMVASMAGGLDGSGPFAWSPTDPGLTMTAAMTNAAGGTDNVADKASFDVLFFVGLLLFLITLGLNMLGARFVKRVRQSY